jgi:hypothetical protein
MGPADGLGAQRSKSATGNDFASAVVWQVAMITAAAVHERS